MKENTWNKYCIRRQGEIKCSFSDNICLLCVKNNLVICVLKRENRSIFLKPYLKYQTSKEKNIKCNLLKVIVLSKLICCFKELYTHIKIYFSSIRFWSTNECTLRIEEKCLQVKPCSIWEERVDWERYRLHGKLRYRTMLWKIIVLWPVASVCVKKESL